jgi:chromosome segregation ATPase
MARNSVKKSVKKSMEALINWIGAKTAPTLGDIKSELVRILPLAEALEEGEAIREKASQIATLEAALEKSNSENADLKVELQAACSQVHDLLAKWQKEEEKKREIPPIQFEILKRLPLVNEAGHRLNSIARAADIPLDEAEIHLHAL